MRYGMVIDLGTCTGCGACAVACKRENATPPGVFWSRVHIYETGSYPNARLRFLPTLCMQCDEPPCHEACPSGATIKRADGIVVIDDEACIGCGYCVWACPYESRQLTREDPSPYHPGHGYTPFEKRGYIEHHKGRIEKCTFCAPRLEEGLLPACVTTCPSQARTFGDLDDPESEIRRLLNEGRAQRRHEQLGTEPKVYYLELDDDVDRTGGEPESTTGEAEKEDSAGG